MSRSATLFIFSQVTIVLLLWQIWGAEEATKKTPSTKNYTSYTQEIVEGSYSVQKENIPEAAPEKIDWINRPLPNINFRGPEGTISTKDFLGTPLVLEFMSTECPYCQKMAPLFARNLPGSGAEMLSVSIAGDNMKDMTRWHDNFLSTPMPGFYAIDWEGQARKIFDIRGTPTTFFINSEGQVKAFAEGEFAEKDLRRLLEYITKEKEEEGAVWLPIVG